MSIALEIRNRLSISSETKSRQIEFKLEIEFEHFVRKYSSALCYWNIIEFNCNKQNNWFIYNNKNFKFVDDIYTKKRTTLTRILFGFFLFFNSIKSMNLNFFLLMMIFFYTQNTLIPKVKQCDTEDTFT